MFFFLESQVTKLQVLEKRREIEAILKKMYKIDWLS